MFAFFATLGKELLLLRRDGAGLLVLFAMPMVLVLVVSLVQNDILEASGQGGVKVLYLDQDGGEIGRHLEARLVEAGLQLVRSAATDPQGVRRAVAAGEAPFGIIVPAGAGSALQERTRQAVEAALAGLPAPEQPAVALEVVFDPTVQGSFRTAVTSSLRLAALGVESGERWRQLAAVLPEKMARDFAAGFPFGPAGTPAPPALPENWGDEPLLPVLAAAAVPGGLPQLPTAVQQNVPAWALFGMFFIVVPLAGTLLRERQEGTLQRLRSIAVSPVALLAGKIAAYVLVCLIQFGLMLLVGTAVLPLFGTPVLEIGGAPGPVLFLAVSAALAATGFGLLVGTLAGSYEQAAMAGAVSVVIAAAVGGVMVPIYVMPPAMQALSVISPLAWGLNGFLDLFVRGGGLADILPNALRLLGFFSATLAAAWAIFCRRRHRGS